VNVTCDRRPVLLWWRCNKLCTSGFMDDVTFAHNVAADTPQMAAPGRVLQSTTVLLFVLTVESCTICHERVLAMWGRRIHSRPIPGRPTCRSHTLAYNAARSRKNRALTSLAVVHIGCSQCNCIDHIDTIRYDTIRYQKCARKLTRVRLIYRTEPTTKKCKTEKLKSKNG